MLKKYGRCLDLNCKNPYEENMIPLPEILAKKLVNGELDGSNENVQREE